MFTRALVFTDAHGSRYFDKSFPHFEEGAKKVYIRNVLMIFGWGASLAPLLCCLPMLMMYQFFGDTVMGACIAVFACVPPLIAFVTTFEHINKCYFLYLVAYFAPLITILAYEAHKHTLTDAVVRQLRDPMTYVNAFSFDSFDCVCLRCDFLLHGLASL